jgi:hypothetical protein
MLVQEVGWLVLFQAGRTMSTTWRGRVYTQAAGCLVVGWWGEEQQTEPKTGHLHTRQAGSRRPSTYLPGG